MVQWRERPPPTNVARVRVPHPVSRAWVGLLLLLVFASRVFLQVLRLSSIYKNQHLQILIRPVKLKLYKQSGILKL